MHDPTVPVRVLLVDDDERFAAIVRDVLIDDGYEVLDPVHTVADVPAAHASLRPDVIVIDLVLPDGDGLEIADRLRADGVDTPIVLFSSLFDQRVAHAILTGGYGYAEKAEGLDALRTAIEGAVLGPVIDLRTEATAAESGAVNIADRPSPT